VDWRAEPVPAVDLSWTETGGPAVQPAERRGFGARLIESGLAREMNARITLDFDPTGLKCRMRLPLSNKLSATK
jgi:two-component sensor histidine kinase